MADNNSNSRLVEASEALAILRRGGVVCVPTESSYGLATDFRSEVGLKRIASLKDRAANAPFALIAGSLDQARVLVDGDWPKNAVKLAQVHWPGPLTLVLPAKPDLAPCLVGPTGGVGVRVSSCAITNDLVNALGHPVTATSANPGGQAPATSWKAAYAYFGDAVDGYLDGGVCSDEPSTLIAFDQQGSPIVLRKGPISL